MLVVADTESAKKLFADTGMCMLFYAAAQLGLRAKPKWANRSLSFPLIGQSAAHIWA